MLAETSETTVASYDLRTIQHSLAYKNIYFINTTTLIDPNLNIQTYITDSNYSAKCSKKGES